jgi:hypothetical protein
LIYSFDRNELKKLTKYFTPFLIFVGSLRLILFYSLFGVKIINYLTFTEVLVSFLDTAIYYLFVLFIPLFIILSFWGNAIGQQNNVEFQKKSEMPFGQRIKTDLKQNWFLIILYFATFILSFIKGTWNLLGFLQIILNPGMFLIFFLLRELRISYKRQFNYNIPVTYLNLFLFSYLFVMLVVQNVLSEFSSITKDLKYVGTTAFVGDEKIISDSTVTYIGQTQEYIFFSNLKTKENIIYPKKDLRKIITKTK